MISNTERIHRVLLLWLELNSAIGRVNSSGHAGRTTLELPWDSEDVQVCSAWRRLTEPDNMMALEQWLCQVADGQSAEWARKALQACRDRIRKGRSE